MQIFIGFVIFVLLLAVLIRAISKYFTVIISKSIDKDRKKREEAVIKRIKPKEPKKIEKVYNTGNTYINSHLTYLDGLEEAVDIQNTFDKGYKSLRQQYDDYLEWCEEVGHPVIKKRPVNRLKVYHID